MPRAAVSLTLLILVLLAVAASAVLVYIWLTSFAVKTVQPPALVRVKLRIEDAKLDSSTGTLVVYARNIGDATIDTTSLAAKLAVYVYDAETETLVAANTSVKQVKAGGDSLWEPGEVAEIVATGLKGLEKGHTYTVKLVVEGVEYVYRSRAD